VFATSLGDGAELRPLEPWLAEEFLAHMDRARASLDPWISWASRNADLVSARATLQQYADKAARDEARLFGIWLDGTLVGGSVIVSFDAALGTCEIGCWLEPAGRGRGLVTRASRQVIDWVVGRGIHRVEWLARSDNAASLAVARRLGMRLDGVLRAAFPWQGQRHDLEVWSVLAPEWPAVRPPD